MTFNQLAVFLAIGAVVLAAAEAANPGDYKTCETCIAVRKVSWCSSWFGTCNYNVWCDKGEESVCVDEAECVGHSKITDSDDCLPTTCDDCLASSRYTRVWCADESRCRWGGCGGDAEVQRKDKEVGCIESCDTCLISEDNTWCESTSGLGSVCMITKDDAEETCAQGFVARTQPAECIKDCDFCMSHSEFSWCEKSGSSSVCKEQNTCPAEFTAKTVPDCIEDCDTCIANPNYTWCHSDSDSVSVCKAVVDGAATCATGFTAKTETTGC